MDFELKEIGEVTKATIAKQGDFQVASYQAEQPDDYAGIEIQESYFDNSSEEETGNFK